MDSVFFDQLEKAFDVELDEPKRMRLGKFVELLKDWSGRVRLISKGDRDHIWVCHIMDCMAFLPEIGQVKKALDFGSGGGLPGIPAAIVRPDIAFYLLEPARMKALFLQHVTKELALDNVEVIRKRSEELSMDEAFQETFPVVTARAVAALPRLWESVKPFLCEGGCLLTLKGPNAKEEFEGKVPGDLDCKVKILKPPMGDRIRSLVVLRHANR